MAALRGLSQYDLVVIGGEKWGPDDQALVSNNKVDSQVHVVGSVAQAELPLWYSAASALLYLSDYEGFGLPVLEAAHAFAPSLLKIGPPSQKFTGHRVNDRPSKRRRGGKQSLGTSKF